MDKQLVSSTNISAVGYDDATETLEVEFLNGSVYQYYNVPAGLHEQLMQASSKGVFLNVYIKNAFPYSRV